MGLQIFYSLLQVGLQNYNGQFHFDENYVKNQLSAEFLILLYIQPLISAETVCDIIIGIVFTNSAEFSAERSAVMVSTISLLGPKTFCRPIYFLGTWFPGSTTFCTSAKRSACASGQQSGGHYFR